jgi:hypothetical protein
MARFLLFVALGIIVWRMVRVAIRSMQTPRQGGSAGPSASPKSSKGDPDLGNIQDADFEDITDKTPPSPPSKE